MRNATSVLPFKTRRPTRRHYFLRVLFRPFSFFMRTMRAKINPVTECHCDVHVTCMYCCVPRRDSGRQVAAFYCVVCTLTVDCALKLNMLFRHLVIFKFETR